MSTPKTQNPETPTPQPITERIADWRTDRVVVDRQLRLVSNVALTGAKSRNGYEYTDAALHDAVSLYENKPVFLDHATDGRRPQSRSTRDLVGSIINPRFERGRIRGDIRVLDTESGRTFLTLAEDETPHVGMSHVVMAVRSRNGKSVERIEEVISVDAVVFPATTETFHESHARFTEEFLDRLESENERLTNECETLKHELLRQAEIDRVNRLLRESSLPSYAVSEGFREQLMESADDTQRRTLIAERQALIDASRRVAPVSRERTTHDKATVHGQGTVDQQFVSMVRAAKR